MLLVELLNGLAELTILAMADNDSKKQSVRRRVAQVLVLKSCDLIQSTEQNTKL